MAVSVHASSSDPGPDGGAQPDAVPPGPTSTAATDPATPVAPAAAPVAPVAPQGGPRSLRPRILAIALVPSLSLMLVGLGTAAYTGYQGYQAVSESGKFAALSGTGERTVKGEATRKLLEELRDERERTGEFLGVPGSSLTPLKTQWKRTDDAAAALARAGGADVITPAEIASLVSGRTAVQSRSVALVDGVARYSTLIAAATARSSTQLSRAVADPRVIREDEINRQLVELGEHLEVSGALAYSAFGDAGMSSETFRAFARETGDYQALLRALQPALPPAEAARLNLLTTGSDGEIVAVVQRNILRGSVIRSSAPQPAAEPPADGQDGNGQKTDGQKTDGQKSTDQKGTGQNGTDQKGTGQNGNGRNGNGQSGNGQDGAAADPTTTAPAPAPEVPIGDSRVFAPLPVPGEQWEEAETALAGGLVALQEQHLSYAAGIARDVGRGQVVRALVGSVALLLLALVVLLVSLSVSRSLISRLQRLRRETLDLSQDRLPSIVQRLQAGQPVDVEAELPRLDYGVDEIGQVAKAFDEAQRTAVAAAAGEARTRTGLRTVFMDIAHRSQAIVYRQLKVLDQAERTQEDPEQLELLFRLDHLATRTRRNAENLIILGGGQAGRQWTNPVPLLQLIRSAISEAEDYTRVTVSTVPQVNVPGSAVSDLIHLVAELVDNATSFSPPTSRVELRGNLVGRGLVVEIEDQGLGIEPEQLERFNSTLHEPPDFDVMALAEEPRLGLFVVARLAAKYGIRVTLLPSVAYGGTKVVVLVPSSLLLFDQTPGLETGSLTLRPDERPLPALAGPPVWPGGRSLDPAPVAPVAPAAPAAPVAATVWPGQVEPLPPIEPFAPVEPAPAQPAEPASAPVATEPTAAHPAAAAPERPQLPRRVRQTHLSPLLRQEGAPAAPAAATPADVDPEVTRNRMSALQRGTQQGRAAADGEETR